MTFLLHENLYRTDAVMRAIRKLRVTVCGAGALGANVAESLARSGYRQLRVIDRDRVEERNLSTQPYQRADVGGHKATLLANALYRAVGVTVDGVVTELVADNARKLLRDSDVVIDTFDNSVARGAVRDWCISTETPCLHAGLADAYAEVIWTERYRVPEATNDDVCDYPLARSLSQITAGVVCELLARFAADGTRASVTFTLRDLSCRSLPSPG